MASRTKPPRSALEAVKREIQKPGEDPFAKVCAYGRNGSGKTRFGASAPKVLLVDMNEEGDRTVKGWPGVRVIHVRSWESVGDVYWYLKSGNHPFKSVSLDTVTGMSRMSMDFVLGEAEDRDPTRERSMPDKRSYGRSGQLMRGMLYAYRNLPMHVVFLAQERVVRDPDTEEIVDITVDLSNASRGAAMDSVGVLGRLVPKEVKVKGESKRTWRDHLYLAPHEVMKTKDRTNSLGPVLRDPTMDTIIQAWQDNPPKED